MRKQSNFQEGKVYKIVSDVVPDIYIGSTTETLSARLSKHKHSYKQYLDGKYHKITSHEIIRADPNCRIELLEHYPCTSREELLRRECHYVRMYNGICVNKRMPGRTQKQYYQENKIRILTKNAQYYADNREKILEKLCSDATCECGNIVNRGNLAAHRKTKKHKRSMERQRS